MLARGFQDREEYFVTAEVCSSRAMIKACLGRGCGWGSKELDL